MFVFTVPTCILTEYCFFAVAFQKTIFTSSVSCFLAIPHFVEDEMVAHRTQSKFIDSPELTVGLFAGSNGPALLF